MTGISDKEIDLELELIRMNTDITIITETKKNLKGSKVQNKYILIYSGVPQSKRAPSGVAILLKKQLKNRIHSYKFISDSLICLRMKLEKGFMTILGVYTQEEGKNEDSAVFYEELQQCINSVNKADCIIIVGDFNSRIGNKKVGLVSRTGENTLYENGKMLINFCTTN